MDPNQSSGSEDSDLIVAEGPSFSIIPDKSEEVRDVSSLSPEERVQLFMEQQENVIDAIMMLCLTASVLKEKELVPTIHEFFNTVDLRQAVLNNVGVTLAKMMTGNMNV